MRDRARGAGRAACWLAAAAAACAAPAARGAADARVRTWTVGRETYVGLRDAAAAAGLLYEPSPGGGGALRGGAGRLEFEGGSRRVAWNGTAVWLHAPVRESRRRWAVARADYETVLAPLLRPAAHLGGLRCRVVVLDPGHGGEDAGATGPTGLLEKDVALDLARRVRALLANEGLAARLTREGDRAIALEERPLRAMLAGADLFVSLHLNAAANGDPRGVETYALAAPGGATTAEPDAPAAAESCPGHRHAAANTILGYAVQKAMRTQTAGEDRGLRRSRFAVLRQAPCPAVLVECGFLTHPVSEELLRADWYRDLLAEGLAAGLLDYRRQVEAANPPAAPGPAAAGR